MFNINHSDAISLENIVRDIYSCDKFGISGLAFADSFESDPLKAAILVVAYIHATNRQKSNDQYDTFLSKYKTIFEYPDENNASSHVSEYISELMDIAKQYC